MLHSHKMVSHNHKWASYIHDSDVHTRKKVLDNCMKAPDIHRSHGGNSLLASSKSQQFGLKLQFLDFHGIISK